MNDETIQGVEEENETEWGYRFFCPDCGAVIEDQHITQEWNGSTENPEIVSTYYCAVCEYIGAIPDDMPGEAYPIISDDDGVQDDEDDESEGE